MVANRGALSGLAVPPHPAGSLLLHSRLTATANMPKPNDGGCFLRPLSMPTLSLGGFTSCRGFFRLVAASCRQAMVGPLCRYAAPRLRIARPIVQTCLECASPKHIHLACPTLSLSRSLILSGLFSLEPPRLLKLAVRLVKAHSLWIMDKGTRQCRFVRYLNVERYRRLLRCATDEDRCRHLQELIADEQQKQKNAGDPKHPY